MIDVPRSEWWLLPFVGPLLKDSCVLADRMVSDMCAWGAKHPVTKALLKRQTELRGTISLPDRCLRKCLGHRGTPHAKISGHFEQDGRTISLQEHMKRLPQNFSVSVARELLEVAKERRKESTDGREQSSSSSCALEEVFAAASSLPRCPKCKAKDEGRKWTGPHKRETHRCDLSEDPR